MSGGSSAAASRTGPSGGRPKPRPTRAGGGGGRAGGRGGGPRTRWFAVALLVLGVLVGLPLAHALVGEIVALLVAAMILGFLFGRWTGPATKGKGR